MKSAVVVLGLFAMLTVHATTNKNDMEDKFKKALDTCKNKTGLSDEDLKKYNVFGIPQTRSIQCFSACFNKEMGSVFPNNTMNIAKIREMNADLKETNPEYAEKMNKISEICATKDIADTDECIAAKKLAQCYVEEADKIGFKMNEM